MGTRGTRSTTLVCIGFPTHNPSKPSPQPRLQSGGYGSSGEDAECAKEGGSHQPPPSRCPTAAPHCCQPTARLKMDAGTPVSPPAPSAALLPPYAEPTPAPRGEEKLSSLLHVLL